MSADNSSETRLSISALSCYTVHTYLRIRFPCDTLYCMRRSTVCRVVVQITVYISL